MVTVRRVAWHGYRVPFVRPFATAHGTLAQREGCLVTIQASDGAVGYGDAAPMPGFGGGAHDACACLAQLAPLLVGVTLDRALPTLPAMQGEPGFAAARFALETALLDLIAQQRDISLAALLAIERSNTNAPPAASIPVNATIGSSDTASAVAAVHAAVDAGFDTIKLKVAVCDSLDVEMDRIRKVRQAAPGVSFRLDANGGWTVDQAMWIVQRCQDLSLDYLEQPVAAADLTGMALVRAIEHVPIAADESVTDATSARAVLAAGAADVLIVKPGTAGGLRESWATGRLAAEASVRVVLTSLLESGIGVVAAVHLAAAWPDPLLACGLATIPLLESSLLENCTLRSQDGRIPVPAGPGLGVTVDAESLERYAAPELSGGSPLA